MKSSCFTGDGKHTKFLKVEKSDTRDLKVQNQPEATSIY